MKVGFNSGWSFWAEESNLKKQVTLPHDAMLTAKRSKDAPGGSGIGFFEGGSYVYEKYFDVTEEMLCRHLTLEFEGVYKNAEIFLNDQKIGEAFYGYTPFFVELDGKVQLGQNLITVKAENKLQPESRWYSGAGIYRPVWMHTKPLEHIAIEGIQVKTLSIAPVELEISIAHTVEIKRVELTIPGTDCGVKVLIPNVETALAWEWDKRYILSKMRISVDNVELWDEEHPRLYELSVKAFSGKDCVDSTIETFGIRKIEWNANGLFVNGRETLLRGGCLHHDNGILGACAYEESEDRRVKLLKENGFNAIRSAHNPCSKALLRACDKYGVYLMDELWDMWYVCKNKHDYANEFFRHYKDDIKAMIRRDFNHPSVIMYSIGNEVSEPAHERGVQLAREMTEMVHSMDSSRPVTGGFNLMIITMGARGKSVFDGENTEKEKEGTSEEKTGTGGINSTVFNMITSMVGGIMNNVANGKKADMITSPVLDTVDIAGYNYASGRYPKEGRLHPSRIVVGSETFPFEIAKNWEMVKKYPYLIGDFMWTAWDYIGEAGVGAWNYESDGGGFNKKYPWLLADSGAFDLLGNPTGEAFLAKAVWGYAKKPLIAVRPLNHKGKKLHKAMWRGTNAIPGWSYQGCEGVRGIVEVYTDAPLVELFLNGKSMGKKKTKRCQALFSVRYIPGALKVVTYDDNGKKLADSETESASGRVRIDLAPEKWQAVKGSLVYIPVRLAGENGVIERNAEDCVTLSVTNGEIIGFGSARPRTEESYLSFTATTYYGEALAVIRVNQPGETVVCANSVKYGSTEVSIRVTEEM
ncbi:MAG: glycoside hydrolase family 2 TIM barrel-domain containing protein [Oliverpabstia sp.]